MGTERLRDFVQTFTRLIAAESAHEERLLSRGRELLGELVAFDDWLPDAFAQDHPERYQQYLLHCDPLERFSVVSFVWGPGQRTPVHDHTVWGLIGILRGRELTRRFRRAPDAHLMPESEIAMVPGMVDAVSPAIGDIHEVANGLPDRPSVSIHVYGANIGAVKRHVFDIASGKERSFISGYSRQVTPNLWDRSTALG
jgi:predicted metal-dependent enzyme (double-stranded beta helix superfamily)